MSSLFDLYNRIAAHEVQAPHNACEGCINFTNYDGIFVCNRYRNLKKGMPQHCDLYQALEDNEPEE